MEGLQLLLDGSPSDKLKILFDIYNVRDYEHIEKQELYTVLKSCMEESALQISDENLDALTTDLFEAADTENCGVISFEELRAELEKNPEVIENLTVSTTRWFEPPDTRSGGHRFIPRYLTWRYIHNNLKKWLFLVLYFLVNAALAVEAGWRYRDTNWYIIIARACGQCLNFNASFTLCLMLRQCLTFVRATKASNLLPLDHHITFHKMVGLVIGFLTVVHTVAHIGNIIANHASLGLEIWECLFTTNAMVGTVTWHYGTAYITGWILDLILLVMIVCSMPFVRRSGHFQVFYWTHLLYVWFWAFLLVHGPRFWKWFVAPGVIFLIEKISRSKLVKMARYGKTYIQEVNLLPSGVTHLVITRPTNFHFRAGDYIYVQIPAIAKYEWHPFTISSAPDQLGTLWIHVRSAGQWTNRLYKFFEEEKRQARHRRNASIGEVNLAIDIDSEDHPNGSVPMTDLNVGVGTGDQANHAEGMHLSKASSTYPVMPIVNEDPEIVGFRRTLSLPIVPSEKDEQNEEATGNNYTATRRRSSGLQMGADPAVAVETSNYLTQQIRVYIDGPYGTPTREIMQAEHAVLIGAGIGVTPFASILQSIMHRYKKLNHTCPKCNHTWMGDDVSASMRLTKVDFIWINRDQKCFEWFVSLLTLLEMEQAKEGSFDRFLELHMFMTAAPGKTDVKRIGLQMALDLLHRKSSRDLITGLKTRTHPGRPDWDKLFTKIAEEGRGKVKVFFCGSPALGKVIKAHSEKFKFKFSKENF